MIKFYFIVSRKLLFLAAVLAIGSVGMSSYAGARLLIPGDTVKIKGTGNPGKITDTRKDKPAFLNTAVKVTFTPYKPAVIKPAAAPPAKAAPVDNKLLNVLRLYPNPVDDQVNISYHISRTSTVTIKLKDVLGTELSVLMSQKVPPGEQLFTYNFSTKLNSGVYFILITANNESIVKRISVQ